MNYSYKELPLDFYGNPQEYILRLPGTIIPFNPNNPYYQDYLAWLAEGNTPEPADPVD